MAKAKRLMMTNDDGFVMLETMRFMTYLKQQSIFDFTDLPFEEVQQICQVWAEKGRHKKLIGE